MAVGQPRIGLKTWVSLKPVVYRSLKVLSILRSIKYAWWINDISKRFFFLKSEFQSLNGWQAWLITDLWRNAHASVDPLNPKTYQIDFFKRDWRSSRFRFGQVFSRTQPFMPARISAKTGNWLYKRSFKTRPIFQAALVLGTLQTIQIIWWKMNILKFGQLHLQSHVLLPTTTLSCWFVLVYGFMESFSFSSQYQRI